MKNRALPGPFIQDLHAVPDSKNGQSQVLRVASMCEKYDVPPKPR